ncbi:MAG TPA: AMP-binding protein [Burkholderiales bacterium]|nr:AMP-binding protein [Burkholderiales bacterium]
MHNNLACLLTQHQGTPEKLLYRQWMNGEGGWRDFNAGDMLELAARWQQAYRNLGFERGDRIALCAKNGVQWVAADLAAVGMGLVSVPLYVIDNPENVAWCVANSESRLLLLENRRVLDALRGTHVGLPPVVVCVSGEPGDEVNRVETWLPRATRPFEVTESDPDTLATIVYTSGTTGRPKGVKLSHRNILWNVEGALRLVTLLDDDLLLSILPLSHTFERTCGYYLPLWRGLQVAYCRGIQQLPEDLATVRPTIMIAVPRVFERFLARLDQALTGSWAKRELFHLTVRIGWRIFKGEAAAWERAMYPALKTRVATPIMERLGGRLRLTIVGGAALDPRIAHTFIGLGLTMVQGYGLTETSPVVSGGPESDNDPLSAGRPLDGLEVRMSAQHELQVRGPSVMQGYWRNPEATAAVLSGDGWLNTGDQVDIRDGRIFIKGRTKDILVLSNGEKLPPDEVEAAILHDPLFEQVMLVGEGRPFLVLLAVSQETDARKLQRRANELIKAFPKWVRVRRVIATREPWSVDNGLLTPTLKVRRREVAAKFKAEIERAYTGSGLVV